MTTKTKPKSVEEQAHDADLGHYCRTHRYDEACQANPNQCRSFCGLNLADVPFHVTGHVVVCMVCDEMIRAKGWDVFDP